MSKDLHHYRKSYEKGALTEENAAQDPMDQFTTWFNEAETSGIVDEPNAMTVSTYGADGFPGSRIVLLKEYNAQGFVFYTNYNSEKGQAIEYNPHVCISFFWPELERQIIIKGIATKVSEERSLNYFNKRPRESRLGALVSDQSNYIESRELLEHRLKDLEAKYEGQEIPKPKNWGGFNVEPLSYEFWQGRKSRLHDRIRYNIEKDQWVMKRLQP